MCRIFPQLAGSSAIVAFGCVCASRATGEIKETFFCSKNKRQIKWKTHINNNDESYSILNIPWYYFYFYHQIEKNNCMWMILFEIFLDIKVNN